MDLVAVAASTAILAIVMAVSECIGKFLIDVIATSITQPVLFAQAAISTPEKKMKLLLPTFIVYY